MNEYPDDEIDPCAAVADEECQRRGLRQLNDGSPEDAAWEKVWTERRDRCYEECTDGNLMMQRAEAASSWINRVEGRRKPELEMWAFLSVFHPEMTTDRQREVIRSMRGSHDQL